MAQPQQREKRCWLPLLAKLNLQIFHLCVLCSYVRWQALQDPRWMLHKHDARYTVQGRCPENGAVGKQSGEGTVN